MMIIEGTKNTHTDQKRSEPETHDEYCEAKLPADSIQPPIRHEGKMRAMASPSQNQWDNQVIAQSLGKD